MIREQGQFTPEDVVQTDIREPYIHFAPPTTAEKLLGRNIENPLGKSPIFITEIPSTQGSTELVGVFGDPLSPHKFYGLIVEAAKDPTFGESVQAILADLRLTEEKDNSSLARKRRHKMMLGGHWQDIVGQYNVIFNTLAASEFLSKIGSTTYLSTGTYQEGRERLAHAICYEQDPLHFDRGGRVYENTMVNSFVRAAKERAQNEQRNLKEVMQEELSMLDKESIQSLVVAHENENSGIIIPEDQIPATHHQKMRYFSGNKLPVEVSWRGAGKFYFTIFTKTGAYGVEGVLGRELSKGYREFKLDTSTVENMNVVIPAIRIARGRNRKRRLSTELFDEVFVKAALDTIGFRVPEGSHFASQQLSTLAGISAVLSLDPGIKRDWKRTYSYRELMPPSVLKYVPEYFRDFQQGMGPLQTLGLQLKKREDVARSSLLGAMVGYHERHMGK